MNPPRLSQRLLRRLSPDEHRDEIDGDLNEWFARTAAARGARRARWGYRRIVLVTAWDRTRIGFRPARHVARLAADARIAARRLRATPGFLAAAVLSVGLGLGANALMFGAVHGFLFRPLPFQGGDSLVWIFGSAATEPGDRGTVTGEEGDRIARGTGMFAATAAMGDSALIRQMGPRHERWRGIWATRGLVDVLGVRPIHGSVPSDLPSEDAPRLMLLGHARWTRDFDANPDVVGRLLVFADDKRFVVAGILPAGLEFPFGRAPRHGHGAGLAAGEQDYWILAPDRPGSHPGGLMVARLAASRTAAQASASLRPDPDRALAVVTMREQVIGRLAAVVPHLQLFALFVLAVACANVGSLALARAVAAASESTLRLSLGARVSDLVRMASVEAALIVAGGWLVTVVIMKAGVQWLQALAPRHGAIVSLVTFDTPVIVAVGTVSAAIVLTLGAMPALNPGWARMRGALAGLVVGQMALSVALVSGAGVLAMSLHRVLSLDTGYDVRDVVVAETVLYVPDREAMPALDRVVDRLRALPGGVSVGFVHSTPLTGQWVIEDRLTFLDGAASGKTVAMSGSLVAYDYFHAMRIGLVSGRTFVPSDLGRRDFPIVIDDVAARRFFPDGDAVGARVFMTNREREIVGVVRATRDDRLEAGPEPRWYQPGLFGTSHMVVRMPDSANRLAEIRDVITSVDSRFIIQRLEPLSAIVSDEVLERRLAARVVLAFGAVAVVLSAIGLLGVTRFSTLRRRREFGVRVALGATRQRLCGVVLRDAMRTASLGIAIGSGLSLAVMGGLQHLVFGARPLDSLVTAGAALLMLGVSLPAAGHPAWRAAAVDPLTALKRDG